MPDPQNPVVSDSGSINPRALAEQLDISLAELARMVGMGRSTLAAEPLGRKGHEALAPLVRLLAFATEMAGSYEDAVEWFKHTHQSFRWAPRQQWSTSRTVRLNGSIATLKASTTGLMPNAAQRRLALLSSQ